MFCMACGAQNNDTAQFCAKCGKPLTGTAQGAQAPAAAPAGSVAQNFSQPVQQVQYGQAQGQPYSQQPNYMVSAPAIEGCMSAGWKDITSTPGWFKRALLLCLINLVPLLGSITITGYSLRWARDLSFGKRETMPTKIFRKHEMATGFKAFLVAFMIYFIWGLLGVATIALIAGLFALINFFAGLIVLGILLFAYLVVTLIFVEPAVYACQMRMAITGVLEKGFNVKDVWQTFRRAMGSLIAASLLPNIIVGIVKFIIGSIFGAITTAIFAGGAYNLGSLLTTTTGARAAANPMIMLMNGNPQGFITILSGALLLLVFTWIISYVIDCFFDVFANLWSYRSVGHWAARNASEWGVESDENTLDTLQEESLMTQQAYVGAGLSDYSKPLC